MAGYNTRLGIYDLTGEEISPAGEWHVDKDMVTSGFTDCPDSREIKVLPMLRPGSSWMVTTSGLVTRWESTRARLVVWSVGGHCWVGELLV